MEQFPTTSRMAVTLALILFVSCPSIQAAQYTDSCFGYSFVYPDTWQAQTWADHPGTVVLRSFAEEQYLHGGNVPPGGAEITVRTFPPYTPDWPQGTDEYTHLHAVAARTGTILSETTRASGAPARVKSTWATASGTTNTSIWTAVRFGGRIFSIFMDYQTADPAGPQYEQIFSDLLTSLSVPAPGATPSAAPTP